MTRVRAAAPEDAERVLALNRQAVPATSPLAAPDLDALAAQARRFTVVDAGEGPLAFMLTLGPGQPYASPNYRWFSARYADFAYVDRVVVAAPWRGRGLGAALYADLDAHTPRGLPLLCEVNLHPPNPGSLRFHERLGFVRVGEQRTDGGQKHVVMLALERM